MSKYLRKIIVIYASGFLQGIALIAYPAVGNILKSPAFHGLEDWQYGLLFVPQSVLAIITSFSASLLARRYGMKRVLSFGLFFNLLSMLLLGLSHFVIGLEGMPFILLLLGTAALGGGFGLTITALNPYAYQLFPGKEASALTSLHFLLGVGTSTAPLVVNFFEAQGIWWGAGLAIGLFVVLLLLLQLPLPMPLELEESKGADGRPERVPARVWLWFVVVFFYGACEVTFSNWSSIYLKEEVGLSMQSASFGLSLFWISIAVGRVLFSLIALRVNTRPSYLVAPLVIGAVFALTPILDGQLLNYGALLLGGLAASFFFPYSISLATDENPRFSAAVSGMLVAALQLAYGVINPLIGGLNELLPLSGVFRLSSLYGFFMLAIAIYLFRSAPRQASPMNN